MSPTDDGAVDAARVDLGGAGVFALTAYVRSRAAMTEEFERRMPAMYRFVTDWLHARRDPRESRSGLTAKSSTSCRKPRGCRAQRRWRGHGGVATWLLRTYSTMAWW